MLRVGWLLVAALLLSACGLPALEDRSTSRALMTHEGADTQLGQMLAPAVARHPGQSGVLPLADPVEAFAARMLLTSRAQRAIDVQYYIWRDDLTGNLLLQALRDAARRNVRVRLLLDDNGLSGLDDRLALLDAEPNVEVRLFNPFPFRRFKPLGFLVDFNRLNRRMHNKSMTVDGQLTIVGGRNIGDEYFGATQDFAFVDLDILAAGAIVDEVSEDFDRYWNSPSAYPIRQLVAAPLAGRVDALAGQGPDRSAEAQAQVEALSQSDLATALRDGALDFHWTRVRMASDDPAKVLGSAQPETLLLARLLELLGRPEHSLDLISPYLVPTEQGVAAFAALAEQGVRLRILTNALEATDVLAVHAGYARYRTDLLESGIELFEMRRQPSPSRSREKAGPLGSSGSSLHAKIFVVDGRRVFVGSFNFDPRSARLNTELGFVMESEQLAGAIADAFDHDIPDRAYELALDEQGRLVWLDHAVGEPQVLDREPAASLWKRLYIGLLSLLPIEPLL